MELINQQGKFRPLLWMGSVSAALAVASFDALSHFKTTNTDFVPQILAVIIFALLMAVNFQLNLHQRN